MHTVEIYKWNEGRNSSHTHLNFYSMDFNMRWPRCKAPRSEGEGVCSHSCSQWASRGTRHHCTKPLIYSWGPQRLHTHTFMHTYTLAPFLYLTHTHKHTQELLSFFFFLLTAQKLNYSVLRKAVANKRLFLCARMEFYSIPMTPPPTSYCPAIC